VKILACLTVLRALNDGRYTSAGLSRQLNAISAKLPDGMIAV
jgi:hypothetical protein